MSWTGGERVPTVDAVLTTPAVLAVVSGLALGMGLIVAIGAQNAFVLRQGLRGQRVGAVVLVCALSDVLLIAAGVAGAGAVVQAQPVVLDVVRFGGAAFLAAYGLLAARRATRDQALTPQDGALPSSLTATLGTAMALTWLNPHVYLDTVVLLGSLANQQENGTRWVFAAGAVVGSILWFCALGYGARALSGVLNSPRTWRVVDCIIGVVMLGLAIKLILG